VVPWICYGAPALHLRTVHSDTVDRTRVLLVTDSRKRIDQLRRQAEILAGKNAAPLSPEQQAEQDQWPAAARTMLHELSVHQIELEMQNEELRRSQLELAAAKARYFDLYDLAPVGYCTVNADGLIKEVNLTLTTMLGISRSALLSKPISHLMVKEDQDRFYLLRKKLLEHRSSQTCDLHLRIANSEQSVPTRLTATVIEDDHGASEILLVINDLRDQKKTRTGPTRRQQSPTR
jgi:PAS domain S-box-containing protein